MTTEHDTSARVQLRGRDTGEAVPAPPGSTVTITSARRVVLGEMARDIAGAAGTVGVHTDEVVRVEYDNGLSLWMRADDLLLDHGRPAAARDADGEPVWSLGTATPGAPAQRGLLKVGIKLLEFFGVDLKGASARKLGDLLELKRLKLPDGAAPGLFRVRGVANAQPPALERLADGSGPVALAGPGPMLVFLHGTMSSFHGSYGALWQPEGEAAGRAAATLRQGLAGRYGERVLAFEHRTLSHSPIRNALELARELPQGAELHLVSHSRGGLVGELLGLAERERGDDPLRADRIAALFEEDRSVAERLGLGRLTGQRRSEQLSGYAQDREDFVELLRLLDEKQIRVTRFVRVACPAKGTTLASGRLDRWLSVLDLLLPGGLIGDGIDFLFGVIKERTDPRSLPGLEAMMPGSALTRLLHLPDLRSHADLSVIAGDCEGDGLWSKLKLMVADWFYAGDHDLVVNTGSMFGGVPRPPGRASFRRDAGDKVNHFRYFSNPGSIGWLGEALAAPAGAPPGFGPIEAAVQSAPRRSALAAASRSAASTAPRPLALMIPGTMGSALKAQGSEVWLDYWSLARGGLGRIGIDEAPIVPHALIDDFYGPLAEHLARTHRVELFPYDWRRSVRDAAARLAEQLATLLPEQERSRQPVHLVAHSMGGLVARAMIADGGKGAALWRRIKQIPGSRLLMLGTPNLGSHEAVRWLVGANPTQGKLALLDLTRGSSGVIDIVRRFPGLAELLPFDQPSDPWADPRTWAALKADLDGDWPLADAAALRQAAGTWALLRQAPPEPEHMLYVAGCQPATVVAHQVVDGGLFGMHRRFRWLATWEGDGTVTWASGRLPGVPTWYAPDTGHDELCANVDDRRIFRGYTDLLLTGRTDQLPASPPVARSGAGADAPFELREAPPLDDWPDAEALRGAGFGGPVRRRRRGDAPAAGSRLRLSVRHADLSYARHPVLVGHYIGDTIISAERALDARLRGDDEPVGPLQRRLALGLYPGPVGTHAAFFNQDRNRKPEGAIVLGLGPIGSLSPAKLEAGVRDALLDYALCCWQRQIERAATGPRPARLDIGVSAVLIGTGDGGLAVRDAVEAIVRGALAVNQRLEAQSLDSRVLLQELELVELYERVAIQAAQALQGLVDGTALGSGIDWAERVVTTGRGGRQRPPGDALDGWPQRLDIAEDSETGHLHFVASGQRARAEMSLSCGQLGLADAFIARACGSAGQDSEASRTLFEMLLPVALKESAPDARELLLQVDEASARFPWELLEDRWGSQPPALQGGVVRQLRTETFRAQPRHSLERSIYVVGNPYLGDSSNFADLPGARREAQQVGELFRRHGYQAGESIDGRADEILAGLHGRAWRVLHLAGHGEHDFALRGPATEPAPVRLPDGRWATPIVPKSRRASGMVIGPDTFLTPGDVEQMRHVPELVFVNCCHLGKTGGAAAAYGRLAANLGVQFIRMGVRAVVCAGWAVDDAAALTFAETFYGQMLEGRSFGRAVLAARRATRAAHPQANTWGAYQCYGDPGYRLELDGEQEARGTPPPFFSPSELVQSLRHLREDLRLPGGQVDDEAAARIALEAHVAALTGRVPESRRHSGPGGWLARADVAAELGFVYGEARLYEQAVAELERALAGDEGDCPVRAAEQCASFRIRQTAERWALLRRKRRSAARDREQQALIGQIEAALVELDWIHRRAPTSERLALLGSACKRLAWLQQGRPRHEALLNMAQYYREAAAQSLAEARVYPAVNAQIAALLLHHEAPDLARETRQPELAALAAELAPLQQAAEARRVAAPDFWAESALGDLDVLALMLAAAGPGAAARLADTARDLAEQAIDHFRDAIARGTSRRELGSVQENLDFLIALTAPHKDGSPGWPAPLHEALTRVRQAI